MGKKIIKTGCQGRLGQIKRIKQIKQLWQIGQKKPRKLAAKYLVLFLSFMMICTMVSRGIYAYQMPRVVLGQASQKSIFHTLYAEGTIEAAKETAVVLMEGLRIREVCVKIGEKVEADTVLLYLDETDLENKLEDFRQKIAVAEEKAAALERTLDGDKSSLLEAQYALAQLREQQDACQQLRKKQGQITSEGDGYITNIYIKAGDRTPDSAAMLLADCSGSGTWTFHAQFTEEQAGDMKPGDTVTLQFQNGRVEVEDCIVTAARKTAQGGYEVLATVTADGLSLGENGTLEQTSQSKKYSCCVPLSAIHSDDSGDYVLAIREIDTILGTELSVTRKNVTVADKNESTAALDENALGADEQFVVYADKEVVSGDKVRLFEEEDRQF